MKKRTKYWRKRTALPDPRKKRKAAGTPPGSLIFTGKQKMEAPLLTFFKYTQDGAVQEAISKEQLPEAELDKISWIDVRGLHDVDLVEKIGKTYQVHPLALEDILNIGQRPKLDEYDTGILFMLKALTFDAETLEIKTEQVGIFFSERVVLSFQEDVSDLFSPVRERLLGGSGRIRQRGADYLTYALIDTLVDYYYAVLDQMDEIIEALEQEINTSPNDSSKSKIHQLRNCSLALRRSSIPLREAVGRFARLESKYIHESSVIYLRDLYDHTIQVTDIVENYRDTITGLHELYLSEISYKMNNVMKLLTVISTIFIPLTFLTGLYGMNFDNIPELHWRYSYFFLWGLMLLVTAGLIVYFKRKDWL